MTTVFEQKVTGPALHALVIGVGRQPYCGPGAKPSLLQEVPDLPGAARTALAMARWLGEEQAQEKALPLASLEVAVSADPAPRLWSHDVQPATHAGVKESFAAWHERCDSPDSVALFYFAGHGMALDGRQHALLLEDFGSYRSNLFTHALGFLETYEGMRGCQAPVQLYFVDACRDLPVELEYTTRLNTWVPANQLGPPYERTTDLVLYSTGHGRSAYAPRDGETLFSRAVRAAFAGAGARHEPDGVWRVTARGLADGVGELMNHLQNEAASDGGRSIPGWTDTHRQYVTQDGNAGPVVLRELPGKPTVPFVVRCAPADAQREAGLSVLDAGRDEVLRHRPPGPAAPWHGELDADTYDLRVRFPAGRWQDEHLLREQVTPPVYDRMVKVNPR